MIKDLNTYILIPLLFPVIFFAVALSPVGILGCLGRGILASLIALSSLTIALYLALYQLKIKMSGGNSNKMRMLSVLILTVPGIFLVILA